MKLLAVIADDITINSSANLCHLAYLRGLLENGHQVDLICAKKSGEKDSSMSIPIDINTITFDGVSLYEKKSSGIIISKINSQNNELNTKATVKQKGSIKTIINRIIVFSKRRVRSLYGVYGFHKAFVFRALKFRSKTDYDFVLSFSHPQASHLLTWKLLKKQHIKANHWIQIWEDPWAKDLYANNASKKIINEENRILSCAEKICYVTPLTLLNQQKMYPDNAEKMFWLPLPAYYQRTNYKTVTDDKIVLGYFGDYFPFSRNLKPFYDAVVKVGVDTYICGNPSDLFLETESVKLLPRMSVSELQEYEDKVNTLVFLCNLGGGQVPGKIYQYSATNKNILFILDGSNEEQTVLFDYFSKFNRYFFCKNNVESISNAITRIITKDANSINNTPVEYFDPKSITKELLEKAK